MAEWWQKAYPGGPAVVVAGFPRPLYPPDVNGAYYPSAPGPDVIAYKRAIARLGRWPWTPYQFDASFSNQFSHGKAGGNVGDSGVEGCQRQQPELDATGYVGEKTFNFLRCARIPKGLPNAGQPAFDANCLNLIAQAYTMFKGNPTMPPKQKSLRAAALATAVEEIGYVEGTENDTKYGEWYGVNYQPWCAIFCTWAYETQGDSPSFVKGSRYAYVPYIVSDAQAARYGLSITGSPIPGDLVCYDWNGGDYDHVGIFQSGNATTWKAVEGNTSTSSQSNGGQVMQRSRDRGQVTKVAFVRVAE